jgi:hypothetical protein
VERMQTVVIITYFKIISWHLPGEADKNHEKTCQDCEPLGQEFNSGPHKYRDIISSDNLQ